MFLDINISLLAAHHRCIMYGQFF